MGLTAELDVLLAWAQQVLEPEPLGLALQGWAVAEQVLEPEQALLLVALELLVALAPQGRAWVVPEQVQVVLLVVQALLAVLVQAWVVPELEQVVQLVVQAPRADLACEEHYRLSLHPIP